VRHQHKRPRIGCARQARDDVLSIALGDSPELLKGSVTAFDGRGKAQSRQLGTNFVLNALVLG